MVHLVMAFWTRIKVGTATLLANDSSVVVTFPDAFPPNQTYVVVCTPPYSTSFWVTSKSATGFTFNVGTTDVSNQTINYMAYME